MKNAFDTVDALEDNNYLDMMLILVLRVKIKKSFPLIIQY